MLLGAVLALVLGPALAGCGDDGVPVTGGGGGGGGGDGGDASGGTGVPTEVVALERVDDDLRDGAQEPYPFEVRDGEQLRPELRAADVAPAAAGDRRFQAVVDTCSVDGDPFLTVDHGRLGVGFPDEDTGVACAQAELVAVVLDVRAADLPDLPDVLAEVRQDREVPLDPGTAGPLTPDAPAVEVTAPLTLAVTAASGWDDVEVAGPPPSYRRFAWLLPQCTDERRGGDVGRSPVTYVAVDGDRVGARRDGAGVAYTCDADDLRLFVADVRSEDLPADVEVVAATTPDEG